MSVESALWIVRLVEAYLVLGLLFAIMFVARWAGRVDAMAREGTRGFRLVIVPGVMLWWPLLVSRLVRGIEEPPVGWTSHRAAAVRTAAEERV